MLHCADNHLTEWHESGRSTFYINCLFEIEARKVYDKQLPRTVQYQTSLDCFHHSVNNFIFSFPILSECLLRRKRRKNGGKVRESEGRGKGGGDKKFNTTVVLASTIIEIIK